MSSDDTRFQQTNHALLERFEQGNLEALEADLATFIKLDNTAHIRAQFDSAFGKRLIQVSKWKSFFDFLVIFLYGGWIRLCDLGFFCARTPAQRSFGGIAHQSP